MQLSKYDDVRMAELVKVEEADGKMVLIFQEDKRITISVAGGKLVSEVS